MDSFRVMRILVTTDILVLFFYSTILFAENGVFGAPTIDSFLQLSIAQHNAYEARYDQLFEPNFVNQQGRLVSPSFYTTPSGRAELDRVLDFILASSEPHSRVVYIGRSGTGIMAYHQGFLSESNSPHPAVSDLPFSYDGRQPISTGQREALRNHLRVNHLTPQQIATLSGPTLFIDFVQSGIGSGTLLAEILSWAKEVGMGNAVREKLHFLGCFPAISIATRVLFENYFKTIKELGLNSVSKPTQTEIASLAASLPLPGNFFNVTGRMFTFRISADLYSYAGTQAHLAQESYGPTVWVLTTPRTDNLSFANEHGSPALLELHYLITQGRQRARLTFPASRVSYCQSQIQTIGAGVTSGK